MQDDAFSNSTPGPSTTSRTSVQKVVSVISELCDYKKFLLEEIGFSGLVKLPHISKLNLKFSKWIMSRIDAMIGLTGLLLNYIHTSTETLLGNPIEKHVGDKAIRSFSNHRR